MKKILTIIGARPQFIKSAPVSAEIKKSDKLIEVTVHTGQHYDPEMSDVFFNQLGLPEPTHMLNIHAGTHGASTGLMLIEIEKVIFEEKPDFVLVYGDTNSTLAGALAAAKLHIPILHVEAGLRSHNMKMPEEINRKLTDHVSMGLFATSTDAKENLIKEGVEPNKIYITGDVMQDCVRIFGPLSKGITANDFILCTLHRPENVDNKEILTQLVQTLRQLIEENNEVIFPIHPRTKKMIETLEIDCQGITFINPVGYLEMLDLVKRSRLVMTDSGGLQKEAYYLDKMCITLRKETEWIELVQAGYNVLPKDYSLNEVRKAIDQLENVTITNKNIYGDGFASKKIIEIIENL